MILIIETNTASELCKPTGSDFHVSFSVVLSSYILTGYAKLIKKVLFFQQKKIMIFGNMTVNIHLS